ncbi:uncharacterized protein LOC143376433 [Andrena cerasifolii]|uniref:uncharacterized protein LOC143376433 n=1 Tax=Andrena cerasifolii TaxID=2819439 RepID=UPI00403765C4
MILCTKPQVLCLNERKIHVSRKPGLLAWSLLSLSAIIFTEMSRRMTENVFYSIILLLGEIMFSLDAFGEWQDLLLDKDVNNVVIRRSTWIDKLCCKATQRSCVVMKLNDVRYVGVSMGMGLFILHKDGRRICLSMEGFARNELQNLRKNIDCFLKCKSY